MKRFALNQITKPVFFKIIITFYFSIFILGSARNQVLFIQETCKFKVIIFLVILALMFRAQRVKANKDKRRSLLKLDHSRGDLKRRPEDTGWHGTQTLRRHALANSLNVLASVRTASGAAHHSDASCAVCQAWPKLR